MPGNISSPWSSVEPRRHCSNRESPTGKQTFGQSVWLFATWIGACKSRLKGLDLLVMLEVMLEVMLTYSSREMQNASEST